MATPVNSWIFPYLACNVLSQAVLRKC